MSIVPHVQTACNGACCIVMCPAPHRVAALCCQTFFKYTAVDQGRGGAEAAREGEEGVYKYLPAHGRSLVPIMAIMFKTSCNSDSLLRIGNPRRVTGGQACKASPYAAWYATTSPTECSYCTHLLARVCHLSTLLLAKVVHMDMVRLHATS